MAMVAVVYWLLTGSQVDWLGPNVSDHLRCFCRHRMNRVNSRSALSTMTAP